MKSLIGEIHRRSLWQVLAIYLGASWLVLQVVDTMAGALSLPDWSASFALFALIIGLPIVLATAFVQEGVAKRPRAADPVEDDANEAISEDADTVSSAESAGRHLFSWRNAILGGVGVFAVLGLLTAGWLVSRSMGVGPAATLQARGVIEDQALVVLADFDSADPEIGAAATEALRVDLSQSGAIKLADRSLIGDALERMERDPSEALTADVAEELARREGAGAVVQGQISQAGDGYVFSVQLVSTTDGSTLTSQRETASDGSEVIDAIEGLSTKLRERIGESLGSIREGEPLARVTTANLEALELYSRGYREPRSRDALPYYEQAVALDSGFAMAWNSIAVVLRNQMSERARALEARTKAFAARDRLTGRERHLTSAMYYMDVEDDLQRAAAEYEAMLELDPNDPTAMNNVGLIYGELGDNESAERYYRDFIALNPDEFAPGYWNLVQTQIQLGKWDDAWMTIDTVTARFADPDDPSDDPATYLRTLVAANQGDLDGAIGILTDMIEQVPRGAGARLWGDLGAMYGARGRLSDARDAMSTASGITRNRLPSEYWEDAIQRAWLELLATGQQAPTIAVLDEAESTVAFLSLEVLDRPYGPLAELLARAGQVDRARDLLAEADSLIAPEHKSISFIKREMLRAEGEVALAEGRFDEAISAFRRSDRGECRICALRGLAAAYEATGQADSAIAVYTRYVDTPFPDRYASYSYALGPALAPTLERLGQMHDERGDRQEAATYFARFVEIWADSDSELQPRVNAAQGRLEEILREIG